MTVHSFSFFKMQYYPNFNSHKVFSIIILLIGFSACSVSKFSNKQKGEKTAMKVTEDENFVSSSESGQPLARGNKSRGVITAAMLIQGVSLGAEALKKFIDNEKAFIFENLFKKTCDKVVETLGEKPFHIWSGLNVAVFDSTFTTLAKYGFKDNLISRFNSLKSDDAFVMGVRGATADESIIELRMQLAKQHLVNR